MISLSFVYVLLWLMCKECIFFNSFFCSDERTSFLVIIFPILLLIYSFMDHSSSSKSGESNHYFYLFRILSLLFFRFLSCLSVFFLLFLESCVILIVVFIFRFAKDKDKISSTFFIFLLNMAPSVLFIYFSFSFLERFACSGISLSGQKRFLLFFMFVSLLLSKLPIFLLHF